jgi:hypothetical protein
MNNSKQTNNTFGIPGVPLGEKAYLNLKQQELNDNFYSKNIFRDIFNVIGLIVYYIFQAIITLITSLFDFMGKTIPPAISTFNIILLHILFFLFLYTLGHLIIYGRFPSYDFLMGNTSKGGNNTKQYTENEENEEINIIKDMYDYIGNTINKILSNIFGIFGFLEPTEFIKRNELFKGRCDDINNVTNNTYCTSNFKINNIKWNLNNNSEDYNNLPIKDKNKETINIPYIEDTSGFYIPDCKNSYYTKTGEKTNLLENKNKRECKYIIDDAEIYNEIKIKNVGIGSYI